MSSAVSAEMMIRCVFSALRLLGVHLMLSLQAEHGGRPASSHQAFLRQVLKGAASRRRRATERLLQRLLVHVRVEAGVLLDGGHAGAVRRGGTRGGAWRRGRAGGEGRRFEDPNR